jgi:2-(1,2-epoxy-1,2-dihydrophenyl)acetyl-CoA isomerase
MESKQNSFLVTTDEGIATMVLNRPEKYNAMDEDALDGYIEALQSIAQDDSIRSLIITGAGSAFCAGADRDSKIFSKAGPWEFWIFMQKINEMILTIRNMPKPVIAAVNGPAVGGGCNVALACDIIIASQSAYFCQIYSKIGIHPDAGGTYFLPRLVGPARACELMFTGRAVSAAEALEMGMINRVVPADRLMDTVQVLARKIAARSPMAIKMIKNSIYGSLNSDLGTVLEQEAKAVSILMFTEDHEEAMAALAENRQPVFKGK